MPQQKKSVQRAGRSDRPITIDVEARPEIIQAGGVVVIRATTSDDLDRFPRAKVFFAVEGPGLPQGRIALKGYEVIGDVKHPVEYQMYEGGRRLVEKLDEAEEHRTETTVDHYEALWDTSDVRPSSDRVVAQVVELDDRGRATQDAAQAFEDVVVQPGSIQDKELRVSLQRTDRARRDSAALYILIRHGTARLSSPAFMKFMNAVVLSGDRDRIEQFTGVSDLRIQGLDIYALIDRAAEMYLKHEAGIIDAEKTLAWVTKRQSPSLWDKAKAEEENRLGYPVEIADVVAMRERYYEDLAKEDGQVLPYFELIRDKLAEVPIKSDSEIIRGQYGILRSRITGPLGLELIWSYWHEEGMLVQTMKTISRRFQNQRGPGDRDPLANLEIDPLRPLNNVLWGYIQDEDDRLTVLRRAYEYDHHYGLSLQGRAVPALRTADSRSKFLESFHTLLYLASVFYKEDDDTTVIADGFPLLNALNDLHLVLAEGAHNQFGDLPWTARKEMLVEQWILSRPEIREFLGGRVMVPYAEPWMDRVDTMRRLQGWGDTSITHFRDLAITGERILLSVRYGSWSEIMDTHEASEWARYWRPEIQKYIHAYRSVTGVDLTAEPTAPSDARQRFLPPSVHLARRTLQRAK
jgi:hypothetical protein